MIPPSESMSSVETSRSFTGFTFQLRVTDIKEGKQFYTDLLGRAPDSSPYEDFHEWQLRDEAWLQVGEGLPIAGYPLRLGVHDIEHRCRELAVLGVACGPVSRIEGLAAYCNFQDPWGNCLGFYQDLSDGTPRLPGGRESD